MKGNIFNIERYHIHDGSGIRTAVFFKGCHMKCPWCSNPESQSAQSQIAIYRNLCKMCLMCERICPQQAIYHVGDKVRVSENLCDFCGKCQQFCPYSAREIFGKELSVDEVMVEVLKDSMFYSRSGGGVTLTGGEPLLQPEFAGAIARQCKLEMLDVAVETTGMILWEDLWQALEYADEILMDVKTTEPEKVKLLFGANVDGAAFLRMQKENIGRLRDKGRNIIFRCVTIPGFNYYSEHIKGVIGWAKKFGVNRIDLLPFHQFGRHKYDSLNMAYEYDEELQLRNNDVEAFRQLVEDAGLLCEIGG